MREVTYIEPTPGRMELVSLGKDDFVRLPNGGFAYGAGVVWIAKTMTGRLFHLIDGSDVQEFPACRLLN